jgi:hypothetical protein
MARREDHHQQRQIQYATILPSNTSADANGSNNSLSLPKQTELERAKAVRQFS